MPCSGLHALVERLEALAPSQVTTRAVQERMASVSIDEREIARYVTPRADHYARQLVHRSPRFDVVVLTWMPGQMTPIHNHAGNLGWVQLVQGRIVEDRYMLVPSCMTTELDLAPDVPAPQRGIELREMGRTVVSQRGAIATVDRLRAIHRIGNPLETALGETAVTLHVYSKPHDVCLVFDKDARTCTRRELRFDNVEAMQA
jgi:predicted metal-dependent enzyme (double-stranded beta helix superfamily)